MQSIHSDSLWIEIERLAKASRYRVAAVAYATDDELVQFGKGDLLVVDASDRAIKTGQTDRRMLKRAFRRGAKLFSCPGLHAKVMVFDDVAVVGSANLSQSSRHNLIEAGLVTDDAATVAAARAFVEQVALTADEIDDGFLARIAKIKVQRTGHGVTSKRRPGVSIRRRKPQLWLAGLQSVDDDEKHEGRIARWEAAAAKNAHDDNVEFSHFWITGNSRIRREAQRGDLVIQIWREDGKSKKPNAVYRHVPIRLIRHDEKKTWFFVEERPSADESSVSWTRFQRHLKRVGFTRQIGPNSIQLIPAKHVDALLSLWENGSA